MAAADVAHRPGPARTAEPEPFRLPAAAIVGIALAGLAAGLGLTALAVGRGLDPASVAIGAWRVRPGIGTAAIDPYAQARLAYTGVMQLAANDGVGFAARIDDTGYRLVLGCTYRLSGPIGPTRFWTLTALDANGRAMTTAAQRTAFTSATVLRDISGAATIDIGPEARPGNWLPTSGDGPMDLMLRFYDTPLADTRSDLAAANLPAITRLSCRSATPAGRP